MSNVFGYVPSKVGLRPVAAVLCSRLGLTSDEVRIERRALDGRETLFIETTIFSLETRPAKNCDTWQLSGAVAGTPDEIFEALLPIVQNLRWAGFSAKFEIYSSGGDDALEDA